MTYRPKGLPYNLWDREILPIIKTVKYGTIQLASSMLRAIASVISRSH